MKSDWYGAQGTVANETEEPGEPGTVGGAGHGHRRRVLIADGDAGARGMLVNLVESLGYETVAAPDVEAAIEMARQAPPDAAMIDIGAPMLEGLPAARRMRAAVGQSALLLIALTGWGQPQYRDMALAAGFDVHWVKPVGIDQLRFLLSMTLV